MFPNVATRKRLRIETLRYRFHTENTETTSWKKPIPKYRSKNISVCITKNCTSTSTAGATGTSSTTSLYWLVLVVLVPVAVLPLGHPLTIQRCIRKLKNDSHRPVPQNQILSNCPHLSRLTVHPFLSVSIYWFHFFHFFLSVHCTLACVVHLTSSVYTCACTHISCHCHPHTLAQIWIGAGACPPPRATCIALCLALVVCTRILWFAESGSRVVSSSGVISMFPDALCVGCSWYIFRVRVFACAMCAWRTHSMSLTDHVRIWTSFTLCKHCWPVGWLSMRAITSARTACNSAHSSRSCRHAHCTGVHRVYDKKWSVVSARFSTTHASVQCTLRK